MAEFDPSKAIGKKPASDNPRPKLLREDKDLKSKLEEVNKQVPRHLYRMWHSTSGGNPNLNTIDKITPLSFLQYTGHVNVYDMPIQSFTQNVVNHLNGAHVTTEFSSWSASPMFVLNYATDKPETAYIAVIDTLGLCADGRNSIFYVPALASVFEDSDSSHWTYFLRYDWEFLVHGVVEGIHYKAVSFKSLREAGLTVYLPQFQEGYESAWEYNRYKLHDPTVPFTVQELHELVKMAELFGTQTQMRAAMLITLFCCKKRVGTGTELKENELEEMVKCLGGRNNIPQGWCQYTYDSCYEDTNQVVNVMRAVSTYCWGNGARARFAK
ncbi:hypothetical protein KCU65_g8528, partial [Aureobasidium melanogenum]